MGGDEVAESLRSVDATAEQNGTVLPQQLEYLPCTHCGELMWGDDGDIGCLDLSCELVHRIASFAIWV
ncbi:hypothetical protein D3C80_1846720 [compost metagenome]